MENFKVKTLLEQMSEYFKLTEKIEKLKKKLIVYPVYDIIEEGGELYAVDYFGEEYLIDIRMREMLPNSYFHSAICDNDIFGYDPCSGSIIYNLFRVGITEVSASEGIYSDYWDKTLDSRKIPDQIKNFSNSIGAVLKYSHPTDYGDKTPPTYVLPKDYLDFHSELQASIYQNGYNVDLVNSAEIKELHRKNLLIEIESRQKKLDKEGHNWTEKNRNTFQEYLEYLKKKYDSFC